MTLATKDSNVSDGGTKTDTSSQNADSKTGQGSRSNPVCLDVGVSIRSLPAEPGSANQSIREEVRTVIVFDNGAVLRSSNKLPMGQALILSNQQGRDVVCRVAGGRNLPSVKGYVEVEFIEPVSDFWHIHQNAEPALSAQPASAPATTEAQAEVTPQRPPSPRPSAPVSLTPKPASMPSGSGPSFEDIPGLVTSPTSVSKGKPPLEPARPVVSASKGNSEIGQEKIETHKLTTLADSYPAASDLRAAKPAIPAVKQVSSNPSRLPAQSGEFSSNSLFASAEREYTSTPSKGRMPLIVAAAVLVIAGAGAGLYFMHRGTSPLSGPLSIPEKRAAIPATMPPQPAVATSTVANAAPTAAEAKVATPAQPIAAEPVQPAAAVVPIPSAPSIPATSDTRNPQKRGMNTSASKQPEPAPAKPQAIPNLKMRSPSVPNRKLANSSQEPAPLMEIPSPEAAAGASPAGLLSPASRVSSQPVAPGGPPSAPAEKKFVDAKLISSTRPIYPVTAKETNIQGNVTVQADIDEHGNVVSAKALNGPLLLRQAALDSVKQWKYSPSTIDGKPAASQTNVTVEFRLR